MSGNAPSDWKGMTQQGSGWSSVIVASPAHPEQANENTTVQATRDSWSGAELVAAIQAAGCYVRETEQQTRALTKRLQELVAQVREQLSAAVGRAEAAEARERELRRWAEEAVEAAEERTRAAEMRAQRAEAWLARVAEAVQAEFPVRAEGITQGEDQIAA